MNENFGLKIEKLSTFLNNFEIILKEDIYI
jgi:hypothetical protein